MAAPGSTGDEAEAALGRLKGLLADLGPPIAKGLAQLCLEAPKDITRAEALSFLAKQLASVRPQPRPPANCAVPGPQGT